MSSRSRPETTFTWSQARQSRLDKCVQRKDKFDNSALTLAGVVTRVISGQGKLDLRSNGGIIVPSVYSARVVEQIASHTPYREHLACLISIFALKDIDVPTMESLRDSKFKREFIERLSLSIIALYFSS